MMIYEDHHMLLAGDDAVGTDAGDVDMGEEEGTDGEEGLIEGGEKEFEDEETGGLDGE